MKRSARLSLGCHGLKLFFFGLLPLAGLPVSGGSVTATIASSSGCGNVTKSSTTLANVSDVSLNPLGPLACPGGNGIFAGADANANGTLSALAQITGSPVTAPFSVTSTATLTDTLTFSCMASCGGTLNASLVAIMTGDVFSQLNRGGVEFASYTATITDTNTSLQSIGSGELCPTLSQSVNCTAAETNPSTGYTVTTPFTIVLGDPYTIQLVMISSVSILAGDNNEIQDQANQKDPLILNLPTGVAFSSQSGQFLAPEPSSTVLVASGLALSVALFRRRGSKPRRSS